MTSIYAPLEDHLEGNSNFNTWKENVLNILEEHVLDTYVSTMVEDPTTNVGKVNFKKNKSKG